MWIPTRKMTFYYSERSIVFEHSRQVAGKEARGSSRYERRKRFSTHQCMHLRNILNTKVIGHVHVDYRGFMSGLGKAKSLAARKCNWPDDLCGVSRASTSGPART